MRVGIINYGMGNLGSVRRALEEINAEPLIVNHPSKLFEVDRIILPGVGAFKKGMDNLREGGWIDVINKLVMEERVPMLGICLGMQLLGTTSEEDGLNEGLNLIPGHVKHLTKLGCLLRVPHVGWNEIKMLHKNLLFDGIPDNTDFYFVHSYSFVADEKDDVVAMTYYDTYLTAAINNKHIFGTQFHPEKSSKAGFQVLLNYLSYTRC